MILILTQCFPSRLGGIESLISNLALGIGKTEKVIVFADRHHFFYDSVFDNQYKNHILVRRFGGIKFFRRRKKIKDIRPFIESNQVKLVLADTWKSLELGIDYIKKKKIPVICLAHGNELLSIEKRKKIRIQKTLNKVNTIVANSNFTKNLVKKIIDDNIRLLTIYPGAVNLCNSDQKEVFGVKGSPILLTLARLEKRKGHSKIIDSIDRLVSEFPEIQYIIAGSGPELSNLKKKVKNKKLEKNILFVGNVNDLQKKYLFQKSQLMIMPTLDETENRSIEGFGIVYIEAAFFSLPSVASNIGGTPEAVINNSTGKVINNIDELFTTIKDLLLDESKLNELGQNAKKRAIEKFTWNLILDKYLSLIHKMTKLN